MRQLGAQQPAQRGGRAAHGHRARRPAAARGPRTCRSTCRRTFSSSSDRGRVAAQVGVRQEARADPKRRRPRHPAVRPRRPRSRSSRRPRRSPRSCPRGPRAACAWRPRTTGAPPPRRTARSAPCRPPPPRRSRSSSRLRRVRIAAVATATICSAPTSRATVAWVRDHLGGLGDLLRRDRAAPLPRLFPIRVKARWVTSSRSCPSPASATSSRVVLLPMSMQAQIKQWRGASSGVRGVLELAEQPGDDERDLLADVDGVVADPLDAARATSIMCIAHSRRSGVVADLERALEDLAVEPVDLVVLAHEVLRPASTSRSANACLALHDLRARLLAHPLDDRSSISASAGGSWPASGTSLAMFTHWSPMRSTCLITCSSAATSAQVAGHRRLQREQRQDRPGGPRGSGRRCGRRRRSPCSASSMSWCCERLERAVERRDDQVEAAERLLLELARAPPGSGCGLVSGTRV